ncbi:MAG: hypothetical protein ABI221_00870 [Candidatus Saccharimonadales bacterium]
MSLEVGLNPMPRETPLMDAQRVLMPLAINLMYEPNTSAASLRGLSAELARRLGVPLGDSFSDVFDDDPSPAAVSGIPIYEGLDKPNRNYAPGFGRYEPKQHVQGLTALITRASPEFSLRDKAHLITEVTSIASTPLENPESEGLFPKLLHNKALSAHQARRAALVQLRGMALQEAHAGHYDADQAALLELMSELRTGWAATADKVAAASVGVVVGLAALAIGRRNRS